MEPRTYRKFENRIPPRRTASERGGSDDAASLTARSHYLLMKGQLAGNLRFFEHKASAEELRIAEECRGLADRIGRRLTAGREDEIPGLLECYDLIYRVGHRRVPDSDFICLCKRRAFKVWQSGKSDIAESSLLGMIAPEVRLHPETADKDWTCAYGSIMKRWVETLIGHGGFPDATTYEKYQRLAIVMRENVGAYLGGRDRDDDCHAGGDLKAEWFERNKVDDITTLGTRLLRSYRRFITALPFEVLDFETRTALDNRILRELASRPDLPYYDRKAFALALKASNLSKISG